MNTQQQIDACEQELAALLSRILEAPLEPIKEGLKSLEQQQADLVDQIEKVEGVSQQLSSDMLETQRELKRLKTKGDEAQRETISQVTALLEDSQVNLLSAQEKARTEACTSLGDRLTDHATERTAWLAQSLGNAVSQGALRQQQSSESMREGVFQRLSTLESGGQAMDRKVFDLTHRVDDLHQAILRLQQDVKATQETATQGQRELTALCKATAQSSQNSIDRALRPIRQLLTAALVVAVAGTLLATHGLWSTWLK